MRVIQRDTRAQRAGPGMHHKDRAADAELGQRLLDHAGLNFGRRVLEAGARAPAVSGTVDQDHAVLPGKPFADRLPHHLEIGTRAMEHHDRRTGRVARADIDDVEGPARHLDHPALGRMGPLAEKNAGLRDQHQHRQRRHENHHCHRGFPADFLHQRATARTGAGFGGCPQAPASVDSGVIMMSSATLYSGTDTFAICARA